MAIEIVVPSPGESITQVLIARWMVEDGSLVDKDQEIVEIDSDKATFPVAAPITGRLKILIAEGETVAVGTQIATLEPVSPQAIGKQPKDVENPSATPEPVHPSMEKSASSDQPLPTTTTPEANSASGVRATPLARKILKEQHLDPEEITGAFAGKRITRKVISAYLTRNGQPNTENTHQPSRDETRTTLTPLRLKLAERLVSVKNETAMLTTFNEINMRKALRLKEKYSERFKTKYGIGIGLMSLFAKAVTLALQEFPQVNSRIEGSELVTPRYVDMGIAVSAPKGLVVPVIRNTESLSLAETELQIKAMAEKARNNRISIDDMKGGTFTITNGGVFGSLMSTPILNPPQSGILGMHKIMDRPIAVNGQVEIHPMMYVALSYDHRIIDGRESVGFLVKVKEYIEDPLLMLMEGTDPYDILLDI